ncbi:MAG: ornithine cyclodeaminase family protein [Planctomycetes bacterium]|nr:ornithine cyclodeaminase family protein [Planctomycetota bacterium]
MTGRRLLFLSATDIARALPMPAAIGAMKEAFRRLSAGESSAPARTYIAACGGDALFMPACDAGERRMGIKVVTLFGDNPARGLPRIQAIVLLLDATDGSPIAVLDGTSLTAIRTGAASGAATDLLARPDARVAAIFGAGAQARAQLEAIAAVRFLHEARVHDPDPRRAEAFAREETVRLGLPVLHASSPAEAVDGAGIITTVTTSATPVFRDADLAPGVHINAVGSYKPAVREIPGETVARAHLVVDHTRAALDEAGDIIIPLREGRIAEDHIRAELGEIVAGTKPGRTSPDEITLFKSVGVAVEDLAAASLALAEAERLGLGTPVFL